MGKVRMQKLKTPLEKSEEIFKKNLTKAAETLVGRYPEIRTVIPQLATMG